MHEETSGNGPRPPIVLLDAPGQAVRVPGWAVRDRPPPARPWDLASRRWIWRTHVTGADGAADAVEAATRGLGLAIASSLVGAEQIRLLGDLRRVGDLRSAAAGDGSAACLLDDDERRVLDLLGRGMTVAAVAHAEGWSVRTLQRRLRTIRTTLGVETVVEAVAKAANMPRDGGA